NKIRKKIKKYKKKMVSAWSIGTAQRGYLLTNNTPGPGAYTPQKKQKFIPPQWKIGTQSRGNSNVNNSPGPGSYQIKPKFTNEGEKYSFAGKPNENKFDIKPGPGAYQPNYSFSMKQLPQYSISKRYISSARGRTPGPGQYQHQSTVLNRPSMIFPKSNRAEMWQNQQFPGPGSYKNMLNQTQGPKYGFGTSRRDKNNNCFVPGPGNYNMNSSFNTNKGFSMVSRQNQTNQELVPGPGAYNPLLIVKQSAPRYKIGTASRDGNINNNLPGPGSYQPKFYHRPNIPSYRLGADTRKPLNMSEMTPGPGQYNIPGTNNGPKLTIKGFNNDSLFNAQKQGIPGPGAYKPSENYSSQKLRPATAKIGNSQRSNFNATNKVPGPGNYNLKQDIEGPKWGFGTSQQRSDVLGKSHLQEPGPGAYNIKPTIPDVPHYLIPNNSSRI
ncbi:hypothetical protein IMG5_156010, partial [Ichthyophthirius multifiliis]